jgi:hypothetical protein
MKFKSNVELEALSNATTDTDRFIVSDSNTLKYRTGSQVLSDIGGQASLTNPVTGTGTLNFVSKFTSTGSTLGNSVIYDNGTNVGIGTTDPGSKLEISSTSDALLELNGGTTANPYMLFAQNGTRRAFVQYVNGGLLSLASEYGDIRFMTGTGGTETEKMRINSSGKVGIGTTSPGTTTAGFISGEVLHLKGADPSFIVEGSNGAKINFVDSGGAANDKLLQFKVDGGVGYFQSFTDVPSLRVANILAMDLGTGDVGIGTTSPAGRLHVSDTATLTAVYQKFTNGTTGHTSNDGTTLGIDSDGDFLINNKEAKEIKLYTSDTQTLTISSAGAIKFNSYNSTNKTGTPTYLLGTDASGNIVKTNTIPGSAAGPYLPLAGGTMANTNLVTNMNADLLDGQQGSYYVNTSTAQTVGGAKTFTSSVIISSAADGMMTLDQTGTDTGWSYVNFNTLGVRNYYVGQDASKNFNIYNDNIDVIAISVSYASNLTTIGGDLTVLGGDIILIGTGRIQGIDTVSATTDAANKAYVDAAVAGVPTGDITAVTATSPLTGGGTSGAVTVGIQTASASQAGALSAANWTTFNNKTSNTGTVTSVGISHAGDAFTVGSAVTAAGTLAITMAGAASQYVNGEGNLITFPSIPQGDITGVTAGTNLTGGGTSGSVTLNMATGGVGAGTYGSTADGTKIDTIAVDAYGRVTGIATGPTGSIGASGFEMNDGAQIKTYQDTNSGSSQSDATLITESVIDMGGSINWWSEVQNGSYGTYNHAVFYHGTSQAGAIRRSGNTTVSYITSSDYRLKENVVEITDGIERVKQLKPSKFNFIGEDRIVDGFLAHEVQGVVPESISGEKDEVDNDGNPVYQGIDQSKIVPLLAGALKEAISKIEQLETRIQTLENKQL